MKIMGAATEVLRNSGQPRAAHTPSQAPLRPQTVNDQRKIVAELEAQFPGWQIWVVNRAVGHAPWCARPWSDETAVVNLDSAQQLREYLEQQGQKNRPQG